MSDDLPDAPLVRRVAVLRTFVVDAVQQRQSVRQLRPKDGANVAAGRDLIDVGEVILGGFGAIRNCEHPTTLLPGRTTHHAPRTTHHALRTAHFVSRYDNGHTGRQPSAIRSSRWASRRVSPTSSTGRRKSNVRPDAPSAPTPDATCS